MKNFFTSLTMLFGFASVILFTNILLLGCSHNDWRTADKSSIHLAPTAEQEPQAVVQVYAARTYGWRGYFAVHSWLAFKEKNSKEYTVAHVIGWRQRRGLSVISLEKDIPDRRWFGNEPDLLLDLRGKPAESAIPKILAAIESYPYPNDYRIYPGPNSNTFISHVIRSVPELEVELPPNAIGKDWIKKGSPVGFSESGTGAQLSLLGLLGATVGIAEGVEVNILGMSFGVDILRPALKLPFIGRIGFKDSQIFVKSDEPTKQTP